MDKERKELVEQFTEKLKEECLERIEDLDGTIKWFGGFELMHDEDIEEIQKACDQRRRYLDVIKYFVEDLLIYERYHRRDSENDDNTIYIVSNEALKSLLKRMPFTAEKLAQSFYIQSSYFSPQSIQLLADTVGPMSYKAK